MQNILLGIGIAINKRLTVNQEDHLTTKYELIVAGIINYN